jgi:hypothetical protein
LLRLYQLMILVLLHGDASMLELWLCAEPLLILL